MQKRSSKQSRDYFACFKIKQILLEAANISHPKNKNKGIWSLFHSYCDHFNLSDLPKGSHNWVVFIVCGLEQMPVYKHSDASNSNSLLRNVYPHLRCASLGTLECCIKATGHLTKLHNVSEIFQPEVFRLGALVTNLPFFQEKTLERVLKFFAFIFSLS